MFDGKNRKPSIESPTARRLGKLTQAKATPSPPKSHGMIKRPAKSTCLLCWASHPNNPKPGETWSHPNRNSWTEKTAMCSRPPPANLFCTRTLHLRPTNCWKCAVGPMVGKPMCRQPDCWLSRVTSLSTSRLSWSPRNCRMMVGSERSRTRKDLSRYVPR